MDGQTGGGEPIVLGQRFRLHPDRPLPELDSPGAHAYAAEDLTSPGVPLLCFVCALLLPPRRELAEALRRQPVAGNIAVVEQGDCFWPPLGRRARVFVCVPPAGPRLRLHGPPNAPELIKAVLAPLAGALAGLHAAGLTHRGVRPDNLFWANAERSRVLLGESFTTPAGYCQPPAFESPDSAAAHPAGRGVGTPADDLYALGVTLLALSQKEKVWASEPPAELLQRRLESGSASAMIGADPPPAELLPLIRGLLGDHPDERWGWEKVERWLRGEPIASRSASPIRASRPMRIGRRNCRSPRALAAALAGDVQAGAALLRAGSVEHWLRDTLRDEALALAIERATRDAGRPSQPGGDSLLVAHACLALDPAGPLRFGRLVWRPDGIGPGIAAALLEGASAEEIAAFLRSGLLETLLSSRLRLPAGVSVDRLADLAALRVSGGGVERCLYELNPDLACLSPAVLRAQVRDLPALLAEIETFARTADFEMAPLDTHCFAFVATRLRLTPHSCRGLSANADLPAIVELRLLALAHRAAGNPPLPVLARWLAHRLTPLAALLHNRSTRRQLLAAIARRGEDGDLAGLARLVEHPRLWQEDARAFAGARAEAERLRVEAAFISRSWAAADAAAADRGRQLAAVLSGIAAVSLLALGALLQAV